MEYKTPTREDLHRLQKAFREYYKRNQMPTQYPEITRFLDEKRKEERNQEGLSLLVG